MGSFSTCSLAWLLSLLLLAEAEMNFWLFRQRLLWEQEERAKKEASSISYIQSTILQPLDHFNRQEKSTFKQRFWMNKDYWRRQAGPVFLYIGGEDALTSSSVTWGHHVQLAQKYGALVVALEHRFYGASINPDGLKDKDLKFLSSQQALADLAAFQNFITQKYSLTQKNTWICFGGSYSGNLAVWFRLKFPHLVFAAVASSAPVRAELDFIGYNKVVAASLSNPVVKGSPQCLQAVAEAFGTVDKMLHTGSLAQLARDFHSQSRLVTPDEQTKLVTNLTMIFTGAVQYNSEQRSINIARLCGIMTNRRYGSTYRRLVAVNKAFLDYVLQPPRGNSSGGVNSEHLGRTIRSDDLHWYYQTCTEFGYYQACEDSSCPFSRLMTLQSKLKRCFQFFGVPPYTTSRAVNFTNVYYGADRPRTTRVLFVNGNIDPWHALSVLKDQSRSMKAILINGTSHCADMRPFQSTDLPALVKARQSISKQVQEWLKLSRSAPEGS